jgi:hypothetical protein
MTGRSLGRQRFTIAPSTPFHMHLTFVPLSRPLDRAGPPGRPTAPATHRSHRPDGLALAILVGGAGIIVISSSDTEPAVIEGPAQKAGIRFDPGLVQRIVEETRGGEALPLLGYALQQLYQQRQPNGLITTDTYVALGGVEGALRQRADEVQEALQSEVHGDAIIPALLRLVATDEHDEPHPSSSSLYCVP